MEIQTHTATLEAGRKATLGLMAANYPADAITAAPDKPFHKWLKHYDLESAALGTKHPELIDDSHPYIHIDMSQCIHCFRCVQICAHVQGNFTWRVHNRADRTIVVPDDEGVRFGDSSCVSCGACVDTCPTGALEDKQLLLGGSPTNWTRTTCPYCGTGCEMSVGTRDNQLISIKPVLDAPVSKGHLCVKGRYAFEYVNDESRQLYPMLRDNGDWRRVSWEEAIRFTADRLRMIVSRHGPDAFGIVGSSRATNEENYVTQKFARAVIGTDNVDCCARVCHAPTAAGMRAVLGTGAATNSYDDIERASTILLYGSNATENHPIIGTRIRQAVLHGTKLIVVDPRRTELAQCATLHLPVRPGTDVALLNAMANVITGTSELVEQAAAHCHLDPQLIRDAAILYATNGPAMIIHGLGITEHSQGTEAVMCLVKLALITDNLGKPGTGVNPLRGQNNVQGSAHMGCEPKHGPGFADLPNSHGMTLMAMLDSAAQGELRAFWSIGYDVLLSSPNRNAVQEAMSKLELVVIQDLFLNETAKAFGHVFFPVASSFEKEGTFMNAERRVQRVRKAIEPRGESRTDWQILCDVAKALGHEDGFQFQSAEEIWNEVRSVWKAGAGMSYARLEHAGLQWPCPSEDHPGTAILPRPNATLPIIEWRPSPECVDNEYPFLLTTGRSLFQFNASTMTGPSKTKHWRPTDTLDMSPPDAQACGVTSGSNAKLISRYGEAVLPVRITDTLTPGVLFTTFHSPEIFLNRVTSPHRDSITATPEYKVTAVRVEKA